MSRIRSHAAAPAAQPMLAGVEKPLQCATKPPPPPKPPRPPSLPKRPDRRQSHGFGPPGRGGRPPPPPVRPGGRGRR